MMQLKLCRSFAVTNLTDQRCQRRCRFEPHADRRLSRGSRAARGVGLELRRVPTGLRQTRRMVQIGIGANS